MSQLLIVETGILAVGPFTVTDAIVRSSEAIFPKHTMDNWEIVETELPANFNLVDFVYLSKALVKLSSLAGYIDESLLAAKDVKNIEINLWRAEANNSNFQHLGKSIDCDELARSDINGVAGNISLMNEFPSGFPNVWKTTDNSYIKLATVEEFKAMYSSMTLQGTVNFGRSQDLKAELLRATTLAAVAAIKWE